MKGIFLSYLFMWEPLKYGEDVEYPFYMHAIGFESPFAHGFSLWNRTYLQWAGLFQALFIGQGLNAAIYRAIGRAGVYYGHRLGMPVPWVSGFPFSVVPHPQYAGVCISVIGVCMFLATPAVTAAGWFNLAAVQILLYGYMAIAEDLL